MARSASVCQEAAKKDLIVNTVQCDSIAETTPVWKEVAHLSEGTYAALEQSGNMTVVETPMDKDLAEINREMGQTLIAYGGKVRHR